MTSLKPIRTLLIIEDNPGDARLLREIIQEGGSNGTEMVHVGSMAEAERFLSGNTVDVILLDLGLPDSKGLGAIRRAHAAAPTAPVVVLTGLDDDSLAAQTLREGAQDYLIKGQFESRNLLRTLRYAIERKRLERLKDEFVSTVSHELRTPLTSITASLGLLIGKVAGILPGPAARLLSIAYTNSSRLVRLVNDILDIEKLESGRVVFNFAKVDVRLLVEHAIEANRGYAQSHNVQVRLTDSDSVGEVRADADRLVQVVINLLSNAIKFSPADNEVTVSIGKATSAIRISVRDHGIGIPEDFRQHLFEKFAQADATNARQKGGTGLGLSIVKQIVERLGGEVGFSGAPGGGTIFHVELPTWDIALGHETDLESGTDAPRILLCEDDVGSATVLREKLREAGYAADFAHTAADAMARALTATYAAILVDLNLPDGDGISLILALRMQLRNKTTPIFVISSNPDSGRGDARSPGLNVLDWLRKPIDTGHLVEALRTSIAFRPDRRVRLLHVDKRWNDPVDTATISSQVPAEVVGVASNEAARSVLVKGAIDGAVLNIPLESSAVLDLLPDLHDKTGAAIPLVVVSAKGIDSACEDLIEVASQGEHETSAASEDQPDTKGTGPGKQASAAVRILHVDDEPDIREVVEISLGLDTGFVTRNVGSGKEALAVAAEWMPDLILLDFMMPAMDGPATLVHLRADKRTADIPVVFMTARAQAREIELLNSLGAMGVIDKPFDPMNLAALVRTYLPRPGTDLKSLRDDFRKRVKLEAIVLSKYRSSIKGEAASAASMAGIKTIAHGLAGAGGIFGFDRISEAASSLEAAVIRELDGSGVGDIVPALECLLGCAATLQDEQ
jgi:signal transduction histidine kinase